MNEKPIELEEDPWTAWNNILNKFSEETEIQIIEFKYSSQSPLWKYVYAKINYPDFQKLKKILDELKEKEAYTIIVLYRAEWKSDETGIVAFDLTGYPVF
ncbi:MAG: hypothetical protein QXR44_04390 [Thermoproteota archaeon]|nr:hypothetical protein [Candidatus Brockarchaeota archaeon]